jgi:hypothetical protein
VGMEQEPVRTRVVEASLLIGLRARAGRLDCGGGRLDTISLGSAIWFVFESGAEPGIRCRAIRPIFGSLRTFVVHSGY